ncbi:MAG: peptidase M14, partial [Gemmatimonadetes bacterium]|nr:peptidase M14 [Gemmatimonadota bacterium]
MRNILRSSSLVLLGLLVAVPAAAQSERVRRGPPHPADVFGFEPGADHKLADYGQMLEYYRRLDAASGRVQVEEIGRSVLGRPLLLVLLSSESNLRQLERWRRTSERLVRARDADEGIARRLASEGKVVVWIDGGLHATEVAGAQHTPLLAYRVATDESAEMRRIRENVVLLLMPVMNPDGLDLVADWYRRNLGTPYETAELPWLYHHYVGHDNNRDWYQISQPETRAVARVLYHRWYPQIVYNHHQTGPFPARIFVPPFADPVNPHIPGLVVRGVNLVGAAMSQRLSREGKTGAVSRLQYDMWWNGGMRTAPYFHNMIGILTETALYEYATPRFYPPDSLPRSFRRGGAPSPHEPSISYPEPWAGGWWRLRDAVDYMLTTSLAVLAVAADRKEDWLLDAYRMGRESIVRGVAGSPFAYVIPGAGQWDAGAAVELVNVLRRGGIDVRRATSAFEAAGRSYPAGSHIVYAAQAFRPYLLDLMEKQVYPDRREYDGGPPLPPYDITGWTLPLQYGVRVDRVDSAFSAPSEPVEEARPGAGQLSGTGGTFLLSPRPNAAVLAVNRLLRAGARVSRAAASFELEGRRYDAGTFVFPAASPATRARLEALAGALGLDFAAVTRGPDVALQELRPPRIGLYKSWAANMDEGWTRWLLERYEFGFDTLHDRDIRTGDLSRYDAIILPHQREIQILAGHLPGTVPPEYSGGLGPDGAAALKRFVERGGRLVALDGATDFAIAQFALPVRNALADLSRDRFYIPGSLVRLRLDPGRPLGWGMADEAAAFFVDSRAFELVRPPTLASAAASEPDIVAKYAEDQPLLSGWA